jgi:hypothetical protein
MVYSNMGLVWYFIRNLKLILGFSGYLETLVMNSMGLHFWVYTGNLFLIRKAKTNVILLSKYNKDLA